MQNDFLPVTSPTSKEARILYPQSKKGLTVTKEMSGMKTETLVPFAILPFPLRFREAKQSISMQVVKTSQNFETQSYQEAMQSENGQSWKPEILDENKSLIKNDTWKVVPLPPARKPSSAYGS